MRTVSGRCRIRSALCGPQNARIPMLSFQRVSGGLVMRRERSHAMLSNHGRQPILSFWCHQMSGPPKLVIRFLDTTYEFSRTQRNTKHTGRAGVIAPPGELLTAGETTHLLALRACMGCSICRPVSRSRFRPLCVTVPASACGSTKGFRPARRRRICWRPGIVPGQLVRS